MILLFETIVHLFAQCVKVEELWKNICSWVKSKLSLNLDLNIPTKILGHFKLDEHFWALNFVLIVTRKYIFTCSKTKKSLNIYHLQKLVKDKYQEQEALSRINSKEHTFEKKWLFWKHIFDNI